MTAAMYVHRIVFVRGILRKQTLLLWLQLEMQAVGWRNVLLLPVCRWPSDYKAVEILS